VYTKNMDPEKPHPNSKEEPKDIEGDNFIIKRRDEEPRSPSLNEASVEFRPDASNKAKINEIEETRRKATELYESGTHVEQAKDFLEGMFEQNSSYTETLAIDPSGEFSSTQEKGNLLGKLTDIKTREELYQLAKDVQESDGEYQFSFESDPEGKWIKYSVTRQRPN